MCWGPESAQGWTGRTGANLSHTEQRGTEDKARSGLQSGVHSGEGRRNGLPPTLGDPVSKPDGKWGILDKSELQPNPVEPKSPVCHGLREQPELPGAVGQAALAHL